MYKSNFTKNFSYTIDASEEYSIPQYTDSVYIFVRQQESK